MTPSDPTDTREKTIAIIGAGVSGIASARACLRRGHRIIGIEHADDFGGVWHPSRRYPGIQTQSPKGLYCYTDAPMPEDYPEWPSGPQVHAYLSSYADRHELRKHFRFSTRVVAMRRPSTGRGWILTVESSGERSEHHADAVIVGTGQFSKPHRLELPGHDAFLEAGGVVRHSSELDTDTLQPGQQVVVVGGSKSGSDIAVLAAQAGAASTTLAYRRNVWRVPYRPGGVNFKHLLYMRAQEIQFPSWAPLGLPAPLSWLFRAIAWLNFRGLEALLTLQLGLRKWDMVPESRIEDEASCALPIVTPGLFEALKTGSIVPMRSPPARLEAGTVILANGTSLPCSHLVFATGWRLEHPFLPQDVLQKLVEPDGLYRLHRFAVCPEVPDLGFVGTNSTFCTVLSSEMVAAWLVRFLEGSLPQQPSVAAMQKDIVHMQSWKRNQRPAAAVYGGQCVAPFHFRHFDELLTDMGATQTRPSNPIRAWFTYPRAEDYGRFLSSVAD